MTHLGRYCQCMYLGRRFNVTAVHPHRKKPTHTPTCAISDHEWIHRTGECNLATWYNSIHTAWTGRIIDTLLATLPNFFTHGLTSQITDPLSLLSSSSLTGMNSNSDRVNYVDQDQGHPMYSPSICLEYPHPTAVLAPLPQNFHVKGLLPIIHMMTPSQT